FHYSCFDASKLIEHLPEMLTQRRQCLAEFLKGMLLRGRQLAQAVEKQAVGQLLVRLDLSAKEIGKSRYQERWATRGIVSEQLGKVGVLGQVVSDPGHNLLRSLDYALAVGVAPEGVDLLGEVLGRRIAGRKQTCLAGGVEFGQALLAELGQGAIQLKR